MNYSIYKIKLFFQSENRIQLGLIQGITRKKKRKIRFLEREKREIGREKRRESGILVMY